MLYLILTAAVLSLAALVFLLLPYICFRKTFFVPKHQTTDPHHLPKQEPFLTNGHDMHLWIDEVMPLPYEDVYTASHDGLCLHARYYETAKDAPLQILFHGYRGNALRDFCGGLNLALAQGCNALLVDQRAHGQSDGFYLSFGILERQDALAWANYAVERFGQATPIVLTGISMGASTVLMASALALPPSVCGIVADCGYTSPKAIIQKVLKDRRIPPSAWFFIRLGARLYGRFDPEEVSAPTALSQTKIPVLLIHGEADHFVPVGMTYENYDACASEKYRLIVPGATHGLSYMTDAYAYEEAVKTFLKKVCS